ncbi:MAG: hypothetical protein V7724_03135 [Sediminicola sp.]|tara:strand:- start:79144 stop:79737 length:594 start_codon:yes stop_codon:yes gene_type:complete
MKTRIFAGKLLMIGTVVLLCSCSAEDGEDGAIGPQGPQGEQGVGGPQGEQGEQGEPGTANVIYSDWIPVDYIVDVAAESNLMGLGVLNSSELNQETDVLLVYGQRETEAGTTDGIFGLPFILATQNEYYGFGLFDASGGTGIQVRVNTLDGGANLFTFFTSYRYVIIPGGMPSAGKSTIDYTKMTYEEILERFNIPE